MSTAKHWPCARPCPLAPTALRWRSATATACATEKLTVAVTVMPAAVQRSSTSRPAAVTGSLTAMFAAHPANLCAISYMAVRSPASPGSTCAQTYPDSPRVFSKMGASSFAAWVTGMRISDSAFARGSFAS